MYLSVGTLHNSNLKMKLQGNLGLQLRLHLVFELTQALCPADSPALIVEVAVITYYTIRVSFRGGGGGGGCSPLENYIIDVTTL